MTGGDNPEREKMKHFKDVYTKEQRSSGIGREFSRISKGLTGLDENRRITVAKLLNEAAFMAVMLEETRQIIIRDGIIEQYKNGPDQYCLKKTPAVDVYDKMINTYSKIISQINRVLPVQDKIEPDNNLMNFIRTGGQ